MGGEWSMIWDNNELTKLGYYGRVLKWAFAHLSLLLPGLFVALPQVFSLHDTAQPRRVQGQLLNGAEESERRGERV